MINDCINLMLYKNNHFYVDCGHLSLKKSVKKVAIKQLFYQFKWNLEKLNEMVKMQEILKLFSQLKNGI